jgi:diamine N-acetyltransferase
MHTIKIQKATIADLEIIQEIGTKTFVETFAETNSSANLENYVQKNFNAAQVASELNNPESIFYLANLGEKTLGYLKLNFGQAQTEIHSLEAMEIQRIYVLKEFHGKKIGQLFLNHAVKIGQQSGVDSIWLGVWENNYKAIEFYNKNDFIEFDTHTFTLGDEVQTDILMELRIINQANLL